MTLGVTIRRLRHARGWTQGQLAMHSGIEQSHLSKIEREVHETVNARVLGRIAAALEVTSDQLMHEAGWLPEIASSLATPTIAEQRLLMAIRQIGSVRLRSAIMDQFTWFAETARDAGLARGAELRLVAESGPKYGDEEKS